MKRNLLLFLVALLPMLASAYDAEIDGIYYIFTSDSTATVTYQSYINYSYVSDYSGSIVIPESVTYNGKTYSVTSIGKEAFYFCSGLTSITIPGSVTSIGYEAFFKCSGLTSITIPNSVTSIGSYAFKRCSSLTSITIPSSVTSIGSEAFSGTAWYNNQPDGLVYAGKVAYKYKGTMPSDTRITIEEGTLGIANGAFRGCSGLTSITIPDGVTSIGYQAFEYCSGLTSITIPGSVTSIGYSAFKGCSSLTSITIPGSVTSIGSDAFRECSSLTSVTIQDGVTSIEYGAFEDCTSLASITIPGSVTSIGEYAFCDCSGLTSITIQDGVTSIEYGAFYNCSGLTSITIPGSVTSIGSQAFSGTAWYKNQPDGLVYAGKVAYRYKGTMPSDTRITLEEGTVGIADCAFSGCSGLTSITIPGSVTSIGERAFSGCSGLTSLTIPGSVTSIGDYAFGGCSGLTSIKVEAGNTTYDSRDNCNAIIKTATNTLIAGCQNTTIPNSVTSIGNSAFSGCSGLTSVTIPNGVTSIGNNAFEYCSGLTSITIPGSVTSIGSYAFSGCSGLTSITIPGSVTSIGNYAFRYCSGLTDVYCYAENVPTTGTNIFYDAPIASATLHVPAASLEQYKVQSPWSDFGTIVAIDNTPNIDFADANVKAICVANWDTDNDGELSEAEAAAVTYLKYVFSDNTQICSFDELQFFTGLTSIWSSAFKGCTSLTSVTIPNNVTRIEENAFRNCSSLTSVTIRESVTGIGGGAFSGCSSLTSITIPNSVTSIGESAFAYCSGLTSITIPESVTSIGDRAFCDCTSLTSLDVESGNAVYDSRNGCNAIIETSTNTLIIGCKNTIIPNSVTSIGDQAFRDCTGLTSITIPNSVTSIGDYAFRDCTGLTSVTIPESVTSIGDYAFRDCTGLTSVTIPESVTSIGNGAFSYCSGLTSITIPNSVTSIGSDAFRYCTSLTSVTIGNGVTNIDLKVFYECSNLTSVTIGKSVTEIHGSAFSGCVNLRNILIKCSIPPKAEDFPKQAYNHAILYVPNGSKNAYTSNNFWYQFINIRETTTEEAQLSMQQAYTLMDAGTFTYSVYDPVNDCIGTINSVSGIREDNPNHSWQMIEAGGAHYLYNLGAKKYVKRNGNSLALTDNPEPINVSNGTNGIVLANQTNKQWALVCNESMNVSQSAIDYVTGIQTIEGGRSKMEDNTPVYNLSGQQVGKPQKGINIIRMSDGTTKKVLIK